MADVRGRSGQDREAPSNLTQERCASPRRDRCDLAKSGSLSARVPVPGRLRPSGAHSPHRTRRCRSATLADVDAQPPGSTPDPRAGATQLGEPAAPRVPSDRDDALAPLVPTGPPIRPARRSRWRVVFAVVLAAIPLLCVGVIPLAFHSYDTATRPDRSAPDVVVHNYLQAFLVDRDDASARQFACAGQSNLPAIQDYRSTIEAGEQRSGQSVSFTWVEAPVASAGPDVASVDVRIVATIGGVISGGRQSDLFTFTTHLADAWCVASATRLG